MTADELQHSILAQREMWRPQGIELRVIVVLHRKEGCRCFHTIEPDWPSKLDQAMQEGFLPVGFIGTDSSKALHKRTIPNGDLLQDANLYKRAQECLSAVSEEMRIKWNGT